MSNIVNNGRRVPVVFPFFTGTGGLSWPAHSNEATIAIRDTARGAGPGQGTVDGELVEIIKTRPSPAVSGITLVEVRFAEESE